MLIKPLEIFKGHEKRPARNTRLMTPIRLGNTRNWMGLKFLASHPSERGNRFLSGAISLSLNHCPGGSATKKSIATLKSPCRGWAKPDGGWNFVSGIRTIGFISWLPYLFSHSFIYFSFVSTNWLNAKAWSENFNQASQRRKRTWHF